MSIDPQKHTKINIIFCHQRKPSTVETILFLAPRNFGFVQTLMYLTFYQNDNTLQYCIGAMKIRQITICQFHDLWKIFIVKFTICQMTFLPNSRSVMFLMQIQGGQFYC